MRTCVECGRGVEDEFRFCPHCGKSLRSKIVEYFQGETELGDGGLRVSVYLTRPQHVRLSIWKGETATAALSLPPTEAERLAQFLRSVRLTRRRRLEIEFRRNAHALAESVSDAFSPRA